MIYRFYVSDDVDSEWEMPQRATTLSAGFDLRAYIVDADFVDIAPGKTVVIRTGVSIAMPATSFGMIVSRSGLAIREGLIVLNAPGIIDADYNHEMCVILHNTSSATRRILHKDRIAQIIFMANDAPLDESIRSARTSGFGSTGKQ
jgi:dUTP pyrophosphatase